MTSLVVYPGLFSVFWQISTILWSWCVAYSHNKYAYIHIYLFMQDTYRRNDKRRWKEDAGRLLYKKYLPLTLLQGFERFIQGLRVRGSWRPNITEIFWPQTYGRHVVSFLFFWCSTGGPGVHSAGWWLSLRHLISIFSGPQLISAQKALSA